MNDCDGELVTQQSCKATAELATGKASGQEQWLICFVNICPSLLLATLVTQGDCLFKLWNTALYMKSPISIKQGTTRS